VDFWKKVLLHFSKLLIFIILFFIFNILKFIFKIKIKIRYFLVFSIFKQVLQQGDFIYMIKSHDFVKNILKNVNFHDFFDYDSKSWIIIFYFLKIS